MCWTIAHSFGLKTAVLRMSCIYGPHQFGTEDQGWVAHFLIRALRGEPITIYGDGKQVRDILHVNDAVAAYRAVLGAIDRVSGRAFNLGGGPANAVSLRAVLDEIAAHDGPAGRLRPIGMEDRRSALFRRRHASAVRSRALAGQDRLARRIARPGRLGRRRTGNLRHRGGRPQAASARMRVALVNPPWSFEGSIYFGCRQPHLPLELAYAKAQLERGGHDTLMLDGHLFDASNDELVAEIERFGADMTVVTTAPTYLFWRCAPPELRVPANFLQALGRRGGKTVAVGPHGSVTPARRCASSASMRWCAASARM